MLTYNYCREQASWPPSYLIVGAILPVFQPCIMTLFVPSATQSPRAITSLGLRRLSVRHKQKQVQVTCQNNILPGARKVKFGYKRWEIWMPTRMPMFKSPKGCISMSILIECQCQIGHGDWSNIVDSRRLIVGGMWTTLLTRGTVSYDRLTT